MKEKQRIYTSISISLERQNKFNLCAEMLCIDKTILLSILCYNAGMTIISSTSHFKAVEYQDRTKEYTSMPLFFFDSDHEFMHAHRLSSKISVSKLIAIAIDKFIDDIMENGINPFELAHLQIIENSYKKKSYRICNYSFQIIQNDYFEEYLMKMRYEKT
jgi:hypothetical protein